VPRAEAAWRPAFNVLPHGGCAELVELGCLERLKANGGVAQPRRLAYFSKRGQAIWGVKPRLDAATNGPAKFSIHRARRQQILGSDPTRGFRAWVREQTSSTRPSPDRADGKTRTGVGGHFIGTKGQRQGRPG